MLVTKIDDSSLQQRVQTNGGSTMTATNHDDQRYNLVKFVQRCREFDDFLKARR